MSQVFGVCKCSLSDYDMYSSMTYVSNLFWMYMIIEMVTAREAIIVSRSTLLG